MIEMRVRMQDTVHGETQLLDFLKDSLRRAAWVDDDRLLRDRIADDRTVTAEGWNRERLPNQSSHRMGMLQAIEEEVQASTPRIHHGYVEAETPLCSSARPARPIGSET